MKYRCAKSEKDSDEGSSGAGATEMLCRLPMGKCLSVQVVGRGARVEAGGGEQGIPRTGKKAPEGVRDGSSCMREEVV